MKNVLEFRLPVASVDRIAAFRKALPFRTHKRRVSVASCAVFEVRVLGLTVIIAPLVGLRRRALHLALRHLVGAAVAHQEPADKLAA